jgi:hypothetical protein
MVLKRAGQMRCNRLSERMQMPGQAECNRVVKWSAISHRNEKPRRFAASGLRGFYFRLHPLMSGERGGENTSDALVIHYCERLIVFDRQDALRFLRKTSSGGREFPFA